MSATKSKVLAAAKRAFGSKVFLEERKNAITGPERAKLQAERAAWKEEMEAIEPQLVNPSNAALLPALLKAAQFVVDVNGDAPSIPKLAEAVEYARAKMELSERYGELMELDRKSRGNVLCSWRFTILRPSGICNVIEAQADTLDDLLAKIEQKAMAAI